MQRVYYNRPMEKTFQEAAFLWLSEMKYSVKQSTLMQYERLVYAHLIPEFGKTPVYQLEGPEITTFINQKIGMGRLDGAGGLSAKSVRDIAVVLKTILKFSQKMGWCNAEKNQFQMPKVRKGEVSVLSKDQQSALEAYLAKKEDLSRLGVLICMYTGLRIGEICALKWGDIHFETSSLSVRHTLLRISKSGTEAGQKTKVVLDTPKTESSLREIPLPLFLLVKLYPYRELYSPEAFFLTCKQDRYIEPRTYQYRFKKYLRESGLPNLNFHALRHSFATRCIELGFDIKTLSEILGHADVNTTLRCYVHSSLELKRAQMERLLPMAQ